jgi:DNA-binding NtrC family response regulator
LLALEHGFDCRCELALIHGPLSGAERKRVGLIEDALGDQLQHNAPVGFRTSLPFKEAKGQLVEQFEREYIVDLMKRHRMNLSAAAREAQIDRKHLRELLRKYGLDARGDLPEG